MKKRLKYTNRINRYLSGELSEKARKRFESEMELNPRLKEEYWLAAVVDDFLELEPLRREMENDPDSEEADRLAEKAVREFYEQQPVRRGGSSEGSQQPVRRGGSEPVIRDPEPGVRRRRIYSRIAIAASIAILLAVFFTIKNKPPTTPELFAAYVQEVTSLEMSDELMPEAVYAGLFTGVEQYRAQEFRDAFRTFAGLEPYKEEYPEISLFRGLVLLEIGEYEFAMSAFRDCAKHRGPYRKYARWFRNLAYIRLIHPDVAVMFIIERTNLYHSFDEGLQNMIRRANLLGTGQFKEFRREINPEMVGKPLIIHGIDIIMFILFLSVFVIIPLILLIDILRRRFEKPWKLLFILMVLLLSISGPVAYLILRKRKILKQ